MKRRIKLASLWSAVALGVASLALPLAALAAGPTIVETSTSPDLNPLFITYAPLGGSYLAFSAQGSNKVDFINSQRQIFDSVQLAAGASPQGIAYVQNIGTLYVAEYAGGTGGAGAIAVIGNNGSNPRALLHEWPITHVNSSCTGNAQPVSAVDGPTGDIWFTEAGSNCIGVMDIGGTMLNEYPVTGGATGADKIVQGPGGIMYWTEQNSASGGGIFSEPGNPVPANTVAPTVHSTGFQASAHIEGITFGTGGDQNIYFVDNANNQIGKLDTTTDTISYYPNTGITANAGLDDITNAGNGTLWFAESTVGQIASIDIASGQVAEYLVPSGVGAGLTSVVTGPAFDGDVAGGVWFTEANNNNIGEFDLTFLSGGGTGTTSGTGAGGTGTTNAPKTPDTGLAAIMSKPLPVLLSSTAAALTLVAIARRFKPANR